ncbi:MAG: succinylglutamate desuccinylase/aspartoacylase family protein [Bryobacterales bacterium]|nr:succinylglutamate desuccinylase/aspartoacylase family protein [Bryobacterales bacterium]
MQLAEFAAGIIHRFLYPPNIPVLLARGTSPGPTLLVTAGVHGDEYEGMRAIYDWFASLDPTQLSGNIIAIPVLHVAAFHAGARLSPLDGANLARVFPGNPDGSPTEVLAWHFEREILPLADAYIDLHSAGTSFVMPQLAGYDASDPASFALADAFGASVLWGHPVIAPGRTVSAAKSRRIPWIYTEMRGAGRVHPDDLAFLLRGLRNALRYLNILPGELERVPVEHHLFGDGNVDASITTTNRGFLVTDLAPLQEVRQGQLLGALTDLTGNLIESFHAPVSGVIALIHARPLVDSGEPLFLITQRKS